MDYDKLLTRGYALVPESAKKSERFEIPKAKGHIQGNKTVLTNFFQIASTLRREPEHLLKYILRELATPAVTKGTQVLFGRKVSASRVNETIAKYANTFVICKDCGKPDTQVVKKARINYLKCTACGSQHPINART